MLAFGPVPSTRLGRSLGINNTPPKICTYSCVYCQLGQTLKMERDRRASYEPEEVANGVADKAARTREAGESIDYLTFVPDGEPTLLAYLAIPTRPPAEPWAQAPDEQSVNRAYHIVRMAAEQVEHLIGYEGSAFAFTGDVEEDLLSITAVHPMREDAVGQSLARAVAAWAVVQRLVAQDQLVEAEHDGYHFYLRRIGK